jgi:ABC-2 type transport system permease protein
MLDLASSGTGTLYRKPLLLLANTIDWSLEDRGLLAIRGRDHYSGTLRPLDRDAQIFWEYLIYSLSLLGLILVALLRVQAKRMTATRHGVFQTAIVSP